MALLNTLTLLKALADFCRELDLILSKRRGCRLAGMAFAAVQLCIIIAG